MTVYEALETRDQQSTLLCQQLEYALIPDLIRVIDAYIGSTWDQQDIVQQFDRQVGLVMISGPARSGKSRLMCSLASALLEGQESILSVVVFGDNGRRLTTSLPCLRYTRFEPGVLRDLLDQQIRAERKWRPDKSCSGADRVLLLIDDDGVDWTSKDLRELAMNGRHYNIITLLTASSVSPVNIPSTVYSQLDFIFLLRQPSETERERLFRRFRSGRVADFHHWMTEVTRDFGSLVLDYQSHVSVLQSYRASG